MEVGLPVLLLCIFNLVAVYAVPPSVCSHQFRWEDCGGPPKAVVYYYKSGSRCEVGIWRGCLPNQNMFDSEYECVQTCVFSPRVKPGHYHSLQDNLLDNGEAGAVDAVADGHDNTTVANDKNVTEVGEGRPSAKDVETATEAVVTETSTAVDGATTPASEQPEKATDAGEPEGDPNADAPAQEESPGDGTERRRIQ